MPRYGSVYSSATIPNEYPLDASMPTEVIAGHRALDNILKTVTLNDLTAFEQNTSPLFDTVRALMKYTLILTDYDPLALQQIATIDPSYYIWPTDLRYAILERTMYVSSASQLDRALIGSEYIAIVNIDSVDNITDTSAVVARNATIAHFTVVDSLLGKVYPPVLEFDVRITGIEMAHQGGGDSFYSSDYTMNKAKKVLPTPGRYLVFLKFTPLCNTITTTYFSLGPNLFVGNNCGMYRISSDGTISDETNYFGLGTSPALADVKSAIELRTAEIKRWPY